MAKALQCPACGTKKRIDSLPEGESFRCEQCGQVLKVPPGLGSAHRPATGAPPPAPVAAPRPVASGGDSPPAPRRRARPTVTVGGAAAGGVAVAGGARVVASPSPAAAPGPGAAGAAAPVVVAPPAPGSEGHRSGRGPSSAGASSGRESRGRDALPLPLRIAAWLVALPLALAIVGIPARKAGYLTSQKLLDVIVKSDITRFVPILVIVALWALVTAVLVTLFVEGGRRVMLRRRARREAHA